MRQTGKPEPKGKAPSAPNSKTEACTTRKRYRAGARDTAVKVYTINQESKYVLVENVPALGAERELLQLFALYGPIAEYRLLHEHPSSDAHTDVYWLKYGQVDDAQQAKRRTDDTVFLGRPLRVSYAPQFESVADTREKLAERRHQVRSHRARLPPPGSSSSSSSSSSSPPVAVHPTGAALSAPISSSPAGEARGASDAKRLRNDDRRPPNGVASTDHHRPRDDWPPLPAHPGMARSVAAIRSRLARADQQHGAPPAPAPSTTTAVDDELLSAGQQPQQQRQQQQQQQQQQLQQQQPSWPWPHSPYPAYPQYTAYAPYPSMQPLPAQLPAAHGIQQQPHPPQLLQQQEKRSPNVAGVVGPRRRI